MLVIRKEQLEALNNAAEREMISRISEYMRREHAEQEVRWQEYCCRVQDLNREHLGDLIKRSVAGARNYGFDTENLLTAFTVLRFVSAPNFDKHEAVNAVFRNEYIQIKDRMDALWRYTSEEDWEEIANRYDPRAW